MEVQSGEAITARQLVPAALTTDFQPIVGVKQRSIVGVEALARAIHPLTQAVIPPLRLFEMARREGLTARLEYSCRENALKAFENFHQQREDLILFMNFHAGVCEDEGGDCASLTDSVRRLSLDPSRIAIEILESQFHDTQLLRRVMMRFRELGFLLALDDVGSGHSNLDRISMIQPDILKVDRSLLTHIDSDYHKQETFKSLVSLCRRTGALVVAEGIETESEATVALELGADLIQGYFLSRPAAPAALGFPPVLEKTEALARHYKIYMVAKINEKKLQHRKYNIVLNTILCELARMPVSQFDHALARIIREQPGIEAIYVLDESGVQVTDTICNFMNLPESRGLIFRPALKGADHSLKEYYYVLLDVELSKYTTDPYVSLASGSVCRTLSTCFRDADNNRMYVLCIDATSEH